MKNMINFFPSLATSWFLRPNCSSRLDWALRLGLMSLICCLATTACAKYPGNTLVKKPLQSAAAEEFNPLRVNLVTILPLGMGRELRQSNPPMQWLDRQLDRAFDLHTSMEIARPKEKFSAVGPNFGGGESLRQRAVSIGRELDVQGVIFGELLRYEKSDGGKYGASRSAAVGFRLWLIDPQTGAVLWNASFERSEQPLTENLLLARQSLADGVGYRSSEKLAEEGFVLAAKELERLRVQGK